MGMQFSPALLNSPDFINPIAQSDWHWRKLVGFTAMVMKLYNATTKQVFFHFFCSASVNYIFAHRQWQWTNKELGNDERSNFQKFHSAYGRHKLRVCSKKLETCGKKYGFTVNDQKYVEVCTASAEFFLYCSYLRTSERLFVDNYLEFFLPLVNWSSFSCRTSVCLSSRRWSNL